MNDLITIGLPSKGRLEALRNVLEMSDLGSLDLDSRPLAMEAAGLATAYLSKLHLVDAVVKKLYSDRDKIFCIIIVAPYMIDIYPIFLSNDLYCKTL